MTFQACLERISSRWRSKRPAPVPQQPVVERTACQTIVVIGEPELRPPLEDVVGTGSYDVVFLEEIEGAHARIAQAMPDRIILCCDFDDLSGFQLLSMLQADCRTRHIPALTCVGYHGQAPHFLPFES
jgi:CheY-like chemotaxis protein